MTENDRKGMRQDIINRIEYDIKHIENVGLLDNGALNPERKASGLMETVHSLGDKALGKIDIAWELGFLSTDELDHYTYTIMDTVIARYTALRQYELND